MNLLRGAGDGEAREVIGRDLHNVRRILCQIANVEGQRGRRVDIVAINIKRGELAGANRHKVLNNAANGLRKAAPAGVDSIRRSRADAVIAAVNKTIDSKRWGVGAGVYEKVAAEQ